jgi:MFS transporter, DHA1 family, tetracycline resistance protein
MNQQEPAKSRHKPIFNRYALAFVISIVFLDMVGIGLIFPVLPKIVEVVGRMDLAQATLISGWLFFAYVGMQFLLGPLIGNLSDTYGRRPLLLIAVFGLAVDYTLTAFAPNLWWLFLGRIVAGICGASYTTASACLADITKPDDRAKAFGYMGAAFGLGFVIGPAIGGLLGEYGPRVPFFAAAIVSMLSFVFGYFVLPETLDKSQRRPFSLMRSNPLGTFKVFMTYPQILPLLTVMFLYYLATSIYPAIWSFWGIAKYDWSESMIGLTLACFGLVMAVSGGFFTGPVVNRLGESRTVMMALCVACLTASGFAISPGTGAVLFVTFVNAPEGFVDPTLTSMMSRDTPADAQGELQGGIASAKNLAMLLGTPLFAQIFGYGLSQGSVDLATYSSYFTAAAIIASGTIVFLWGQRQVVK